MDCELFLWTEAGRWFCLGGRAGCTSPQEEGSGQGVESVDQGVPPSQGGGTDGMGGGGAAASPGQEAAGGGTSLEEQRGH